MSIDQVVSFSAGANHPSKCHVRILNDKQKPVVVICTQLPSSPGSVRNFLEQIQLEVRTQLETDLATLRERLQQPLSTRESTVVIAKAIAEAVLSNVPAASLIDLGDKVWKHINEYRTDMARVSALMWVEHWPPGTYLAEGSEHKHYRVIWDEDQNSWTWLRSSVDDLAVLTGYSEQDFSVAI